MKCRFPQTLACRCRVDYLHGQTTFDSSALAVTLLPPVPVISVGPGLIRDPGDTWLQVMEDTRLELECRVRGGRPLPSLTWWIDSHPLDMEYTV